jgi:hypothetical protein
VKWLIEHFAQHQLLWCIDSFVLRNPPLRQAPNLSGNLIHPVKPRTKNRQMDIDHIFIFTDDFGKVAEDLVLFGLTEGSNRIHVGQGTTNRKFYFENFYLKVLWVHSRKEIESELVKPSGLWKRTEFSNTNVSPFGLCIVNEDRSNQLFGGSFKYQPDYFPTGQTIYVLHNNKNPDLPWTFRLPFKGKTKNHNEPMHHSNGIRKLTQAKFEHQVNIENDFLRAFANEKNIVFTNSSKNWLTLVFDDRSKIEKEIFQNLNYPLNTDNINEK